MVGHVAVAPHEPALLVGELRMEVGVLMAPVAHRYKVLYIVRAALAAELAVVR
jgi:hypothetical protein